MAVERVVPILKVTDIRRAIDFYTAKLGFVTEFQYSASPTGPWYAGLSLDGNHLHGSADTYAFLIRELLPSGLKGLMAAALLAAVMSSVSGAVNSIGTLVSYDLLKRWRPGATDRTLVSVGRWSSFLAMILAVGWSLSLNPAV